MWKGPLVKFERAVDSIAATHERAYMAVRSYNTRALPTLGYVAQLANPFAGLAHIEVSAMTKT